MTEEEQKNKLDYVSREEADTCDFMGCTTILTEDNCDGIMFHSCEHGTILTIICKECIKKIFEDED